MRFWFLVSMLVISGRAVALQGRGITETAPPAACLIAEHKSDGSTIGFCTGTLVAPTQIATAKHCFKGLDFNQDHVTAHCGQVGEYNSALTHKETTQHGRTYEVGGIQYLESFNGTDIQNPRHEADVITLTLDHPAQIIKPVPLATAIEIEQAFGPNDLIEKGCRIYGAGNKRLWLETMKPRELILLEGETDAEETDIQMTNDLRIPLSLRDESFLNFLGDAQTDGWPLVLFWLHKAEELKMSYQQIIPGDSGGAVTCLINNKGTGKKEKVIAVTSSAHLQRYYDVKTKLPQDRVFITSQFVPVADLRSLE